ncbi:MAG: 2-dehydropantoate 2-reductase [Pseudomonadota bacterium]|nr:2-dehydropantoate 2-reductase [Pseudomonadota bacterium]
MRVAVVGAGSIGAVLGAKLAATGHEVTLIARGAHLSALRGSGLTLVDHVGKHSGNYRLAAGDDPGAFGAHDLVIIALKAHAIEAMLPRMRALIADGTVVVPAINGLPWWYFHGAGGEREGMTLRSLDPHRSMFAALAPEHILGCVVHIAAEVRAPGEVHHTNGTRIILGEPAGDISDERRAAPSSSRVPAGDGRAATGGEHLSEERRAAPSSSRAPAGGGRAATGGEHISERLQRVCAVLDAAGFEAIRSPDIRLDVWTKLVGNLSFNPIAALTGYLMSEIVGDEDVLDVIRAMMREGMQVAEHYGVRVPMTVEQRIDLARQLGAAKISMLQDLEQRRPLELDAIVGSVMELAERASIAVPTIRHVHALTQARAISLGIGAR